MKKNLSSVSGHYFEKEVRISGDRTLKLRNAVTSDAKDIVEFFRKTSDESENLSFSSDEYNITEYDEKIFISSVNRNFSSIIILGFIDDELCCIAELISPRERRLSHNMSFSITVEKRFWDIGIASAVISEAVKYAKSRDILNICLTVRSENSRAISLYKKYGFEICGVRKNYINIDGVYDDEIIMQLQIL